MAYRHRHVISLINTGRSRGALLFFLSINAVVSLLLLGALYFTPSLEQRHGLVLGIAAVLFVILSIDSGYVVWVTGRLCPMDSPKALRRRSYFVFGATNTAALLIGFLLGQLSVLVGIIGALLALVILPWLLGRRLRNARFDAV